MNSSKTRPRLIVVGSGGRGLPRVFLRHPSRSTVASRRCCRANQPGSHLSDSTIADLADPNAIALAVSALAGDAAETGLLTWDETVLEATAQAAEKLGLPHMSAQAAARCRDKYATRTLLEQAGLASVRHRLVSSAQEAIQCAESFGYPVVVSFTRSPAAPVWHLRRTLRQCTGVALAESSRPANLPTGHGCRRGASGRPRDQRRQRGLRGSVIVHVAQASGFEPYFEEVGHLVMEGVTSLGSAGPRTGGTDTPRLE
jgi:hypothetical protein